MNRDEKKKYNCVYEKNIYSFLSPLFVCFTGEVYEHFLHFLCAATLLPTKPTHILQMHVWTLGKFQRSRNFPMKENHHCSLSIYQNKCVCVSGCMCGCECVYYTQTYSAGEVAADCKQYFTLLY